MLSRQFNHAAKLVIRRSSFVTVLRKISDAHHSRRLLKWVSERVGSKLVSRVWEGIVHISLYSELARGQIVKFRQQYQLKSESSEDDIRAYRR